MLRFVKDIRQLKLKMFGNTTFVLSKKIGQNNKMAFISSPKRLYFTAESTMNVVFGLLKKVGRLYFISSWLYIFLQCFSDLDLF